MQAAVEQVSSGSRAAMRRMQDMRQNVTVSMKGRGLSGVCAIIQMAFLQETGS